MIEKVNGFTLAKLEKAIFKKIQLFSCATISKPLNNIDTN